MLLAMSRLHSSGMPNLKPDAFTYTAVIDVSRLAVIASVDFIDSNPFSENNFSSPQAWAKRSGIIFLSILCVLFFLAALI